MTKIRIAAGLVAILTLGGGIEPLRGQSQNGLDEAALARFVNAPSREAAEEAARAIAGSTVSPVRFDAILSRVRSKSVAVRTRGVRKYTLLLSPDRFDFSQPIRVVTNGALSFEGRVTPGGRDAVEMGRPRQ